MKLERMWSASLIAAGLVSLFVIAANFAGISLPDAVRRVLGLIELAAIFVLVFTTVQKLKKTKK